MSSIPNRAKDRNQPALLARHLLLLTAVAISAWGAGYFMGGGSAAGNPQTQTATGTEAGTRPALAVPRDVTNDGELASRKRRARVLSTLRASLQLPDHVRSIRGNSSAVERIGPEDIQAAVEMVLARNDDERKSALPELMARWAEFDPKAAAAYALGLKEGRSPWFIGSMLGQIATVWGGQDPTAAKEWALSLQAGKEREMTISGLAAGMIQKAPNETLEWVKALPEGMRPKYIHEEIFGEWSERDPLSASKQALTMPKGEERWESLTVVTRCWADKDPQAALNMLQQVPEIGIRTGKIAETLVKWADKDPDAAMAAANEMPVGWRRTSVFGAILSKASKLGEAETSRLLEKIPEGPNRTAAKRAAKIFEEDNK